MPEYDVKAIRGVAASADATISEGATASVGTFGARGCSLPSQPANAATPARTSSRGSMERNDLAFGECRLRKSIVFSSGMIPGAWDRCCLDGPSQFTDGSHARVTSESPGATCYGSVAYRH